MNFVVLDDPAHSWWSTATPFPDASGWLVSTIDDYYWSFVSMMMSGGTRNGVRVLSPATVALMTTDRLTASQREASTLFLGKHGGWGLGLTVPAAGSSEQPFPQGIGWDGGSGTTWRSNQRSGVSAILLMQLMAMSPTPPPVIQDFWDCVNAAIIG